MFLFYLIFPPIFHFLTVKPQGIACPYCQSSFLEEYVSNQVVAIGSGRGLGRNGLSDEQARRLNNAATLLQMLEAQLREELDNLQNVFMEAEARKAKRLTKSMIESLRDVSLNLDMICSQPSCPICSEDYHVAEKATRIPCGHFYHRDCIMPWLESKRTCPICRYELKDTIPTMEDLLKFTEEELLEKLSTFDVHFDVGHKNW